MPAAKTEITEIITGLAMLGAPDLDTALRSGPPSELRNVSPEQWKRLVQWRCDGGYRQEFAAAWANGKAFLAAPEGLRHRAPLTVEWRGPRRDPAHDVVPADLRIDHVFLVSCKYLSKILINASPAYLFDRALRGEQGVIGRDWYQEVAPDKYQRLYAEVARECAWMGLPSFVTDLTPEHRAGLRDVLTGPWSSSAGAAYRELSAEVAQASADRWRASLANKRARVAMLWRLLRMGSAPYFVLGVGATRSLRLRIATPWDWRERFDLTRFDVQGEAAGQPVVRWRALVADRKTGESREVNGHVEIRWSHGRFAQPPEAKVYLDTPHHLVPGYVDLAPRS